jgi:transcriptional regulator with XRE-family HTH domain
MVRARVDKAKLAHLREQRGLTQEQLAVRAGVSKATVAAAEQTNKAGRPRLSPLALRAIATALEVEPDDLLLDGDDTAVSA